MAKHIFIGVVLLLGMLAMQRQGYDVLYAAQPYTPKIYNPLAESWRWKDFPELEGKGIRYVVQAPDQKVWVSCNEGVLEYDGYAWRAHGKANGLDASPIEQLLVAEDGAIYATSTNGIFRYDGKDWSRFFEVPDGIPFTIHRLKQLSDKSIMACVEWGFVQFMPNGRIRCFSSKARRAAFAQQLPNVSWIMLPDEALAGQGSLHYASDVLETRQQEVWLALTTQEEEGSIITFKWTDIANGQLENYRVFTSQDGLSLGEDQRLLEAHDGKIWVINTTSNKGLSIYDGQQWETIYMHKLFGGDEFMADILQSPNGTIWISSMAKIFTYHAGQWKMYRAPNYPVPANRIILQNTSNDQIWITGYKSKVLLLDFSTDKWLTYEDLSFECEVMPGEQWYLERNSRVVYRKGNTWVSMGEEDGLMDAPIRIIRTSKGQIWAAGSHQGKAATALYKQGRWERHVHAQLSWGIDYRAVFEDKQGGLWFGGAVDAETSKGFRSGVLQLPNPTAQTLQWIHHIHGENGLQQANNYGIGQSPDGRIWIGGSRLLGYDGKTWKSATDERLQQFVNYVCSTDKLLLVGSRYYGLFVFDGQQWTNYTTADGLSSNTIISIDALSDSIFVVATENSICKFDGKSWTQDIFPERLNMGFEGGTILHTGKHIWLNHVPRSWKRRVYQRTDMQDESTEFFTTRYEPSSRPPETKFDFFLARVSSEGNSLFSWQGTDYFAKTAKEQLMYSYRLDGGAWSAFTSETQHTFTSLASGDHILEVRARDLDFNIDPTPARIQFEVLPPIWKQGWFVVLMLGMLTLFGIYEYRVITKKQKLEILNTELQTVNDQLVERGHQIEAQNEEILSQQAQILEQSSILEINNHDLEARNEEIQQQRDKLEQMVEQVERLSKAKLGFFTNISHELRTPLSLILGPIGQLRKQDTHISAEQQQLHYATIERNASRLLKLINQLLEMRRIEQNVLELKLNDIRLSDYIAEMLGLFDNLAVNRDIHLEFNDHSAGRIAPLDADKVEKIITNLLSNAFKHTPEGGCICVGLRVVDAVDAKLNPFYTKYFEISVEDTGQGIAEETIHFIFDKYFTTDNSITGAEHTGIGLSYIKDLVYLMQGDIQVSSELGEGAKFKVYLPIVAETALPATPAAAAKPALSLARAEASLLMDAFAEDGEKAPDEHGYNPTLPNILLVEDNPDMLLFLENILKTQYQVFTAENGVQALKAARNRNFDLIVSDVMMPEMDGLTFCETIKTDLATSHIPVILLTAKVMDESRLSGYQHGADDYITKPFNPDLLMVRIDNLLQQRAHLREVFNKEFMFTPKLENISSPDEEFLEKLVALMHDNLAEAEFNVNSMCKAMHISHMHFIRKVKQLTGKKPIDLLKSFRMKKAKDLLQQQKLTISEVAYRVGFDLPNSFSRAFKKEFNVTPSEFVQSLEVV